MRNNPGSGDDFKGNWRDSDEITVDAEEAEDIRLYGGYDDSYTSSSTTNNSSSNNSNSNGPATPATKVEQTAGGWMQNATGWWWCNPDRTYPTNTWKEINGSWYYFDQSGYCLLNTWIKSADGTTWYFCGETGAMVTNVWVLSNNKSYYMGPDGAMWTSRRTPDGYYVDSNGEWIQ